MTHNKFGSEVFDRLLLVVDIPAEKRITVCRDLKDKVTIATLNAINKLLMKVEKR